MVVLCIVFAIALPSYVNGCKVTGGDCEPYAFKDWTGEKFILHTKEECTRCFKILFSHICYESKCVPADLNIYDSAKQNLIKLRNWNTTKCFNQEDRLECSGPEPESLIERGLIQKTESDTYDQYRSNVFHEGCKIHDMCYMNSDMSRRECDDNFKHNMQQICQMRYVKGQAAAKKGHCLLWAQIFYTAVRLGGDDFDGRWSGNECMIA